MKYIIALFILLVIPQKIYANDYTNEIFVTIQTDEGAVSINVPEGSTKEDVLDVIGVPEYYYLGDTEEVLQDEDVLNLRYLTLTQTSVEMITTFETEIIYSPTLQVGEEEVIEGTTGKSIYTVVSIFDDGDEIAKTRLDEKVIEAPRNEQIIKGTMKSAIEVSASAYSPEQPGLSSRTSTGLVAEHGVIAVDPSIIPLGTHVYIPDYGIAIAGDVGGSIKGNKIDVAFDTIAEALQFGRKTITIYILDEYTDLSI